MNIKTLSELSYNLACLPAPVKRRTCLTKEIWSEISYAVKSVSPTTAFCAAVLGEHHQDPIRVMTMLLLNLSLKDQLEMLEVLGTLEPTL
jgi:hypothetical protein